MLRVVSNVPIGGGVRGIEGFCTRKSIERIADKKRWCEISSNQFDRINGIGYTAFEKVRANCRIKYKTRNIGWVI